MFTSFDVMPNAPAVMENFSRARDPLWIPDFFGTMSDSGVEVTHYRALGHPSILQGVKILAGAMAQMKVKLMRRVSLPSGKSRVEEVRNHPGAVVARNRSRNRVMRSGGTMSICAYRSATMNHAIMAGDGWGAIQRDVGGTPIQKTLLPPYPDTRLEFNDQGDIKIKTKIQIGPNQMHSEEFELDPIDVFQIMNLSHDGLSGYPLTEIAANALGFGLATHQYGGKSFANNATPKGLLSTPGNPSKDIKQDIRREWYAMHRGVDNAGKIALLSAGTTYTPIGLSNIDAQLVEILNADVKMQARLLNLPPFLLGVTESSGLKMEELITFFIKFTLGDWICNWAEEMRTKLLTEEQWRRDSLFFVFDTSQFLVNNFKEHLEAIVNAVGGPVLTRDEGRARINLNPAEDDDKFLSRATGEVAKEDEERDDGRETSQERVERMENLLRKGLISDAQGLAHNESQKVSSAVERDDFEAWARQFYNGEWRSRLSDRFSESTAEWYCERRREEVVNLARKSGKRAVEQDAGNFRARGLSLVERELSPNGKVKHADSET